MRNQKFKKVLIALMFTMSMAGSSLMFSACSSKEDKKVTIQTTTEATEETKVSEETTESSSEEQSSSSEFSDPSVQAKADEYKAQGIDYELIDAAFLKTDDSLFEEGFRLIDADGNEYVCAKFSDPDKAYDLFLNDWTQYFEQYYVSNSNHKTMFGFSDNQLEGTVDETGFMEYTVYEGTTADLFEGKEITVPDITYEHSGVQTYFEQSIAYGMTVTDISNTIDNAGEAFEATLTDSDGNTDTTICIKFDSFDDAVAYAKTIAEENGSEYSEDDVESNAFIFINNDETGEVFDIFVEADGLYIEYIYTN